MSEITLHINGSERKVNVALETLLLWLIRDLSKLPILNA
jgi:aerobic-type carbon monoxide dehydrogenase small subunit (CoxS/CutS family)